MIKKLALDFWLEPFNVAEFQFADNSCEQSQSFGEIGDLQSQRD